jgi:hypothetical protein
MKRFALLFWIGALIVSSCTKETPGNDPTAPQDVTFSSVIENGGLKGLKVDDPTVCTNPAADYAQIVIDEITYTPAVFTVNNILYTQAVKLTPGNHVVTLFALMDDNGTPGVTTDDVIVRATPNTGSDFSVFVSATLPVNFTVAPFQKLEIPIEVLCFQETTYKEFGFAWFKPAEGTVRQKWFFGDFCTEYFDQYENSLYGPNPKVDMPAIFRIKVYRDDDGDGIYENYIGIYNNEDNYTIVNGVASALPLEIRYLDRVNIEDRYRFAMELYLEITLDSEGNPVFDYVEKANWYFSDASTTLYTDKDYTEEGAFTTGEDNIYDWVLGFCTGVPADEYVPDPETPGTGEETAFAFGGNIATCFLEDGFNRWGWTNGITSDVEMPIYAGAGQCDVSKGTLVGTLKVDIEGTTATITYEMNDGYKLEETHLYVGSTKYVPFEKGGKVNYTVAPGQYPTIHDLTGATSDTYTVTLPTTGPIYLIAHAVVSGF